MGLISRVSSRTYRQEMAQRGADDLGNEEDFNTGPLSLLKTACQENRQVMINCRHNRKLLGRVKSFDRHCNMVLDEVTEFWMEKTKSKKSINRERYLNKLFLRGDSVILVVSNPNKIQKINQQRTLPEQTFFTWRFCNSCSQ